MCLLFLHEGFGIFGCGFGLTWSGYGDVWHPSAFPGKSEEGQEPGAMLIRKRMRLGQECVWAECNAAGGKFNKWQNMRPGNVKRQYMELQPSPEGAGIKPLPPHFSSF